MTSMAVTTKKLDVHIGDVVEIEGRRYDVVSDKEGGVTLEPAITRRWMRYSLSAVRDR